MKKLSFWLAAVWLCSTPAIVWADPMNMQMDPNTNMSGMTMPMDASTPQASNAMPANGVKMNHGDGMWALEYDYSYTHMDGLRDGTHDVSSAAALAQGYMQVPTDMTMQMHMMSLMYMPSHRWMFMAMVPYDVNDMHETDGMMASSMHSEGWGDAQLKAQYLLMNHLGNVANISAGISLPTGSINERGTMMGMPNQRLPYMMQLGSGTYDPLFGLSFEHFYDAWSLGAKADAIVRLGENNNDYRLGNHYNASLFATRKFNNALSGTFRLDGSQVDNIHGSDQQLDVMMDPTNVASLQAGERVDAVVAFNLTAPNGNLVGSGLSAEFGVPLYQHLDGPQLETDYHFLVGGHLNF